MASMTSLNDNIYPIIDGALKTNSHVIIEIQNVVSEYLDRNMNKLSTSGPIYRTLFLDNDKNAIFKATGTSPELVNRVIKESAYIKNHWRNIASPFNVVMALLISWAKRNKNNDFAMFLLALYSKFAFSFPYLNIILIIFIIIILLKLSVKSNLKKAKKKFIENWIGDFNE